MTADAGEAEAELSATWLWDELGLAFDQRSDVLGLGLDGMVGLALRRNPRRAHLLVSRLLGKHLPVVPAEALRAAHTLAGEIPAAMGGPGATADGGPGAPLVIGFCETATSLGHAVADGLDGADYLHTTRRRVAGRTPLLEFTEAHSHAAFHWLMPGDVETIARPRPLILVDDELTTGRTALGTIRALHAYAPHPSYVVATLFDARPAEARAAFDELAEELGVPIGVASLLAGEVTIPDDIAARAAAVLDRYPAGAMGASESAGSTDSPGSTDSAGSADGARASLDGMGPRLGVRRHRVRRLTPNWPADLPDGGRHGFRAADRDLFGEVIGPVAKDIAAGLTPGGRTLVLGAEEFMYTPLRIADALATQADGDVVYQSTTRSPVHVVDVEGYAVRSRLSFPAPDDPRRISHVYNVRSGLYTDIVLVLDAENPASDDGHTAGLLGGLRSRGSVTVVTVPSYRPR